MSEIKARIIIGDECQGFRHRVGDERWRRLFLPRLDAEAMQDAMENRRQHESGGDDDDQAG